MLQCIAIFCAYAQHKFIVGIELRIELNSFFVSANTPIVCVTYIMHYLVVQITD